MVKAKGEKMKAFAIAGGNVISNALGTYVMLHGINTGAAVEVYQGGGITSTTGKNNLPKFSDVAKVLCGPRNI
jgi:hypothetical protein